MAQHASEAVGENIDREMDRAESRNETSIQTESEKMTGKMAEKTTQINLTIREFNRSDEDYAMAVAIINRVWPDYPDTVAEWQHRDRTRAAKIKWQRYLAFLDGEPVALATYRQMLWMYHPRKFRISVNVLPEHRRQGIGTALYQHLLQELAPHDPMELMAVTREDYEESVRFLQHRGFQEVQRQWESILEVASFDPTPFAGVAEKVAAQGIQIRTVRELESDPERDRKLYELEAALDEDVPSPEPSTMPEFEEWQKVWDDPSLLPDGWFVAVHGDQYVGMSALWGSQASRDLYTGLTGVRRAYRRKGIATAMKLRAIAYAQATGAPRIRTWNEVNNQGMLSINERLGFVRQPASIDFVKKLGEE